jgi:hypothetical protein
VKKERTNGTNEKDASVSCSNWLTAFVHSENRATWANSNAAQQSRGGWMADGETFAKLAAQLLKHFPNHAQ